jgi:hypothetical protein
MNSLKNSLQNFIKLFQNFIKLFQNFIKLFLLVTQKSQAGTLGTAPTTQH